MVRLAHLERTNSLYRSILFSVKVKRVLCGEFVGFVPMVSDEGFSMKFIYEYRGQTPFYKKVSL